VSHFFAYLSRLKLIERWGLMRSTRSENTQEHSLQVAMFAHALAVLKNERFGGNVDPERAALLAVYHDAEEVITGDVPTPVKYFTPEVASAMGGVAHAARERLVRMLPEPLDAHVAPLLQPREEDADAWACVKAADTLAAYLKCVEEATAGNREFAHAEAALARQLDDLDDPAVEAFRATFEDGFRRTLDELA
jgi:5'-deoxynucleotidase